MIFYKLRITFFRIDNFTTNLITGKVTLNLINSFDATVGDFQVSPTSFNLTSDAQTVSSSVTNSEDLSYVSVDVGDGTGWITVVQTDGNLFYTLTENTGIKDRFVRVEATSKAAKSTISIEIQQKKLRLDASSNTITADSNEITADNNG